VVTSIQTATISASYGGATQQGVLSVNPTGLNSVSLNPTSVTGGNASTATVTLTGPAPSRGIVVNLSSGNTSAATVPASVTVAAGSTSATFTVATVVVTAVQTANISATDAGVTQRAVLTVNPPPSIAISSVSPTSLTFSGQNVGSASASQAVTLSNKGSAALTLTGITASSNFGETNNCGSSVAANGSCTINVTFSPMSTGTLSGVLKISDNDKGVTGSAQSVALGGMGQDFTVSAASGSSTSATVAPGSSATYTLSAVGLGGFDQRVSFTCAGAPSESTCAVSPASMTVGSSPSNVTLAVTTTASSGAAPRFRPLPPTPPGFAVRLNFVILALFLAGLVWRIRRWRQAESSRRRAAWVTLTAGLLLTLTLAACGGGGGGGGSGSAPPNAGTPAGTYNLTVTGSTGSGSSSLSHSMTVTLNVS
jgi:hypothetical protein